MLMKYYKKKSFIMWYSTLYLFTTFFNFIIRKLFEINVIYIIIFYIIHVLYKWKCLIHSLTNQRSDKTTRTRNILVVYIFKSVKVKIWKGFTDVFHQMVKWRSTCFYWYYWKFESYEFDFYFHRLPIYYELIHEYQTIYYYKIHL